MVYWYLCQFRSWIRIYTSKILKNWLMRFFLYCNWSRLGSQFVDFFGYPLLLEKYAFLKFLNKKILLALNMLRIEYQKKNIFYIERWVNQWHTNKFRFQIMQQFYTLNLNTDNILIYCQLIDREYKCTIKLFTNDFVQRNLPIKWWGKNQNLTWIRSKTIFFLIFGIL